MCGCGCSAMRWHKLWPHAHRGSWRVGEVKGADEAAGQLVVRHILRGAGVPAAEELRAVCGREQQQLAVGGRYCADLVGVLRGRPTGVGGGAMSARLTMGSGSCCSRTDISCGHWLCCRRTELVLSVELKCLALLRAALRG
jgi:hypothetical protein